MAFGPVTCCRAHLAHEIIRAAVVTIQTRDMQAQLVRSLVGETEGLVPLGAYTSVEPTRGVTCEQKIPAKISSEIPENGEWPVRCETPHLKTGTSA